MNTSVHVEMTSHATEEEGQVWSSLQLVELDIKSIHDSSMAGVDIARAVPSCGEEMCGITHVAGVPAGSLYEDSHDTSLGHYLAWLLRWQVYTFVVQLALVALLLVTALYILPRRGMGRVYTTGVDTSRKEDGIHSMHLHLHTNDLTPVKDSLNAPMVQEIVNLVGGFHKSIVHELFFHHFGGPNADIELHLHPNTTWEAYVAFAATLKGILPVGSNVVGTVVAPALMRDPILEVTTSDGAAAVLLGTFTLCVALYLFLRSFTLALVCIVSIALSTVTGISLAFLVTYKMERVSFSLILAFYITLTLSTYTCTFLVIKYRDLVSVASTTEYRERWGVDRLDLVFIALFLNIGLLGNPILLLVVTYVTLSFVGYYCSDIGIQVSSLMVIVSTLTAMGSLVHLVPNLLMAARRMTNGGYMNVSDEMGVIKATGPLPEPISLKRKLTRLAILLGIITVASLYCPQQVWSISIAHYIPTSKSPPAFTEYEAYINAFGSGRLYPFTITSETAAGSLTKTLRHIGSTLTYHVQGTGMHDVSSIAWAMGAPTNISTLGGTGERTGITHISLHILDPMDIQTLAWMDRVTDLLGGLNGTHTLRGTVPDTVGIVRSMYHNLRMAEFFVSPLLLAISVYQHADVHAGVAFMLSLILTRLLARVASHLIIEKAWLSWAGLQSLQEGCGASEGAVQWCVPLFTDQVALLLCTLYFNSRRYFQNSWKLTVISSLVVTSCAFPSRQAMLMQLCLSCNITIWSTYLVVKVATLVFPDT